MGSVQTTPNDRPAVSALLFAAVLLHNFEEALTFGSSRAAATRAMERIWPGVELPSTASFQIALLVLTTIAAAARAWSAITEHGQAAWLVLRSIAWILLLNVLLPHAPAAITLKGYAPGVITAVAVNLPLSLWILACERGAQRR